MLEQFMHRFAYLIIGDVELNASAHILNGGEARFAHHTLQHHAASHADMHLALLQLLFGFVLINSV